MNFRTVIATTAIMIVIASPLNAAKLPAELKSDISEFNSEICKIKSDADKKIEAIKNKQKEESAELAAALSKKLEVKKVDYTKEGKLDEAVGIRDYIASLKNGKAYNYQEAPVNMVEYSNKIGESFYFTVTGKSDAGPVWGTGPYTYDSALSVAAVHAGLLQDGEAGTLKVTMTPGQSSYKGSVANGATSTAYGQYPASYSLEKAGCGK